MHGIELIMLMETFSRLLSRSSTETLRGARKEYPMSDRSGEAPHSLFFESEALLLVAVFSKN